MRIFFLSALLVLVILAILYYLLRAIRSRTGAGQISEPEIEALQDRLDYKFANPQYLLTAMTHSSFAHENEEEINHNETLEFLGDAVIELITSCILINHNLDMREGEMSKLRALVVNRAGLAKLASDLDLGGTLRLSRGERASGGQEKDSLLSNSFEALVGAVFLDAGFDQTFKLFAGRFEAAIEDALSGSPAAKDYKTQTQEICQARHGCIPEYRIIDESGPDHNKVFTTEILIKGQAMGTGRGHSKKEAEQLAARQALKSLKE